MYVESLGKALVQGNSQYVFQVYQYSLYSRKQTESYVVHCLVAINITIMPTELVSSGLVSRYGKGVPEYIICYYIRSRYGKGVCYYNYYLE